ncbi:winged helix family transcriptional regulator [Streptomyces sp. SID5785]|uniref:winged helix-turn-helix domain-containing protein n=1 Tax=Streptomyces sp. SID5785 TaxID=2690309 RepID=UPI001361A5B2|nr:winged helix-turn-helix domain-containing protein [Streptomyces sp. SID5785]MZD05994.1 winged helix family transcriptional regulator [Streptomyces sp. SID5785]
MAHARPLSVAPSPTATPAAPARHRLRAVEQDEVAPPAPQLDVSAFLPPGATLLPAPPHTLPALPGRPPMIGYLVLVPADQQPLLPEPAPPRTPAAAGGDALISIDGDERTATVDGRPLDLTYLEFELLAHLVAHPHRVHTRDQLVTTVWGYGHVGDGRTVDVHVARLRRKLGAEHRRTIQTVRRVGYRYTPPAGR